MATDRPPDGASFSPVPASTFNVKEKIRQVFLQEAQYLYHTFLTVNSVSLIGTLSISLNGNEDIGVIEVSERSTRVPGSDTFTLSQFEGDESFNTSTTGSQEGKDVRGISKLAKPLPLLPHVPKPFDKNLFDKVTSLGQLELMRKQTDDDPGQPTTRVVGTDLSSNKEWPDYEVKSKANFTKVKEKKSPSTEIKPRQTRDDDLPPENEVFEDWEDDETQDEEIEDKKDEDYMPEFGPDPEAGPGEEKSEKEDVETWTVGTRRSKRKTPLRKKTSMRSIIPKKRAQKATSKLSLKIKLKQLTSMKPKHKVKKVVAEDGMEESQDIPADLACKLCGKKFDTKRAYKRHTDRHWKTFQCDECGKPFSSMDSLTHHKRGLHSATKPYSCEECGATFNFHHSYKLHMRKHRGERPYQCDQCDKSYLTATHLKAHKEAIHESAAKSQYVCDTCGKTFTYRNSLKTHQMIHTGDRPFKCGVCDKGFVTRQALRTHEDSYHVEERNFQCDICFKFYKSEHLRNVHRRRHTSDVNRFMCDICGRQFMFKSNLDAHSFVHQDERPFVCNICQKSFKCMSSLYTHQYTHKTTTPFKCSVCSKTFKTKNCLKAHERRHSAEKNFMCSTCAACFPDKGGLTKHIRTIHSPQKQFVCKFCGKIGTRADNMRTHIKSHGKEIGTLEISECIIEVATSSTESVKELANKSLELSRQMKQKNNTGELFNQTKAPPKAPHSETTVYQQTTSNMPNENIQGPGYHSQVSPPLYQPPMSPHHIYQPPLSPNQSTYQPSLSPNQSTYQLPLSPTNYPQEAPANRTSQPMMSTNHPSSIHVSVGQSHTLQPLVTVTDPSHLNLVQDRGMHPHHLPLPAHMQASNHGPPVFPPVHQHGEMTEVHNTENM